MVERTDPRHTVYIYDCHDCVVQVRVRTWREEKKKKLVVMTLGDEAVRGS